MAWPTGELMDMTIPWWALVAAGVILACAEIFLATFIILWFGIGAMLSGFATLFFDDASFVLQISAAAAIGAALMIGYRRRYVALEHEAEEALHKFDPTVGELGFTTAGLLTVTANDTCWLVANPHEVEPEHQVEGYKVEIEKFHNNRAFVRYDQ